MLTDNRRKLFGVVVFGFVAIFVAFSQSESVKRLAEKYLTEAEDAHEQAKFEEAYKNVNAAIGMYANYGEVPEHIFVIAKPIYRDYLTRIKNTKDWGKLEPILTNLDTHKELQTSQIKTLVKEINNIMQTDKERAQEERQAAQREKEKKEDREMQRELQRENRENSEKLFTSITESIAENNENLVTTITESMAESNENLVTTITESNERTAEAIKEGNEKNAEAIKAGLGNVKFVIMILAGIVVIVLVVVILVHIASVKAQKQQQSQFQATLQLVAGMQQQSNRMLLGAAPDLYGDGLRSAGSSRWGVDALPAPELDEKEKEDLKNLAISCEDLGTKIDQATGRKNNSKNVSELVYKLALNLGLNQNTAMAYFCAAMVYDAGFLSLDESLLQAENLTEEQRKEMHNHVDKKMFKPYFINVPEMYRQIFEDAAIHHHENMDGSGYPEGLAGEDIPQIARLLRVVETYVSLISRRNYRAIKDRDSAINELLSKPEVYDKDVVAAMDTIL